MKAQLNSAVNSCHNQLKNIVNIKKDVSIEAATNLIPAIISSGLDYANSLLTALNGSEIKNYNRYKIMLPTYFPEPKYIPTSLLCLNTSTG